MTSKINMTICICVICVFAIAPIFSSSGEVISVLGKAEVQTASGWSPLKAGDTVESGAVISTGFRSQAILKVGESTITVQALSRLTLQQLLEKDGVHDSEVYLDIGSIRADVASADNKRVGFVVNTPVATASVRGTILFVSTKSMSVEKGSIAVHSSKDSTDIILGAGTEAGTTSVGINSPQKTYISKSLSGSEGTDTPAGSEAIGGTAAAQSVTTTVQNAAGGDGAGSASSSISISIVY